MNYLIRYQCLNNLVIKYETKSNLQFPLFKSQLNNHNIKKRYNMNSINKTVI